MNNNRWFFPTTHGGKISGFNDSGIQFFKDNKLLSLAKEICQNSLDAKVNGLKSPVKVEFSSFYITKDKFPGYENFYNIINKEIDFAEKHYKNDKKALQFYKEAKGILEKDNILCLRISDFNTTGLTGSNVKFGSKWDKLVNSEGFSDNPATFGGSFGIGKNATFACSKLNTVFYSTKDIDNVEASKGVAKLSSCLLENGEIIQGTCYYGFMNETTDLSEKIKNQIFFDPNFKYRYTSGTDIYILGFDNSSNYDFFEDPNKNWAVEIAASIIDNYFVSILDDKLVVKVNDIELASSSIVEVFNHIYNRNKDLFNPYTVDYFDILTSNKYEVITKKYSMFEENDVELKLAFDTKLKNRIAIIKGTGMKVFDKDHLPQISFYSGILKLIGTKVNSCFREMENPRHDGWYPSIVENEKEAVKQRNKLYEFITTSIR